jgi:hypothetical protein
LRIFLAEFGKGFGIAALRGLIARNKGGCVLNWPGGPEESV